MDLHIAPAPVDGIGWDDASFPVSDDDHETIARLLSQHAMTPLQEMTAAFVFAYDCYCWRTFLHYAHSLNLSSSDGTQLVRWAAHTLGFYRSLSDYVQLLDEWLEQDTKRG